MKVAPTCELIFAVRTGAGDEAQYSANDKPEYSAATLNVALPLDVHVNGLPLTFSVAVKLTGELGGRVFEVMVNVSFQPAPIVALELSLPLPVL